MQVKHDQIYFVRFPDPLKCKLWLLFDKRVRELDWIFPKTVSTHLAKFPMHFRVPVRDFLGGTDQRRDCEKRIVRKRVGKRIRRRGTENKLRMKELLSLIHI